ncbi:sulfate reduction electron transfer complex DsrMKJOP subunit DsrO [Thermopetrobacter sp. TC1]|uniref:sulfate reduction electron transfer complex DsrMKJOP subunit DsrO n=1 Tax=Thermopetrobacter sp. TC1 TaxID=1495045 RepID=UPI0009DFE4D2|nr:4Fe-4S dicluster domain-containing protein [Thermopetrobacter sp. TC1]
MSDRDRKPDAPTSEVDAARRAFLRKIGAASTLTLAPGVVLYTMEGTEAQAKKPGEPLDPKKRWGIVIDTTKCTSGCEVCVEACKKENGWEAKPGSRTDVQWIRKVDVKDPKTGFAMSLPVMCQHCANPPCVDVCPTGASMKRADGIVRVNMHICIGCRYCMMACPYKARSFVHEDIPEERKRFHAPMGKGCVTSCDMCAHRVDVGRIPACVEACDKGAMIFGDLNDPTSEIAQYVAKFPTQQIRADLGTDPGVRYARLP